MIITQADLPPLLTPGAEVAVIAPSGRLTPERLTAGLEVLRGWGLQPVTAPHVLSTSRSRQAWVDERRADLRWALLESGAAAIWAARGGFGAAHLLADLVAHERELGDRGQPVPLIGFSDATAFMAAITATGMSGVLGVHGPGVAALADRSDGETRRRVRDLLLAGRGLMAPVRHWSGAVTPADPAPLVGGNLSTLASRVGTPYQAVLGGCYVVLEDVGEPVHRLDRMVSQLELSGSLDGVRGVVLGAFSDAAGPRPDWEDYMAGRMAATGLPVLVGLPVGHVPRNWPWVVGQAAQVLP